MINKLCIAIFLIGVLFIIKPSPVKASCANGYTCSLGGTSFLVNILPFPTSPIYASATCDSTNYNWNFNYLPISTDIGTYYYIPQTIYYSNYWVCCMGC